MSKKGFTLLELLVVIVIISILSTVMILSLNPTEITKKARDAKRITDISQLNQAIGLALSEDESILANFGSSAADTRLADGTGYVKVIVSRNMPILPIPNKNGENINNSNNNQVVDSYYFQSVGSSLRYEIKTTFESMEFKDELITDGGNESDYYEVGSDLTFTLP